MTDTKKKIVLASASTRRRDLLEQIGLTFEICASKGPEITTRFMPEEVVKELSYQKAKDVYNHGNRDAVVIGADTIVWFEDEILGKPMNEHQCKEMLKKIQGSKHYVYTGVTIMWCENDSTHMITFYECTKVKLHAISDDEIDDYIATGESMDKAGGYGIQGYFARFVDGIEGDYNNVVGLPVGRLYQEMKKLELI
ncbi:MAG: septum formation protein Maf [Lachnospiraceae bacterium]|nr:septum formation protein Maf [Candidatus Colinaster equi]